AVHDRDALAELGRRSDREVDREGRPTDAALGAEDRDDEARLATVRTGGTRATAGRDGHDLEAGRLVAFTGADLADRGCELVAAERFDEELASAGEHRAAEV